MRNILFISLSAIALLSGCGIFKGTGNSSPVVSVPPDMLLPVASMEKGTANFNILNYDAVINITAAGTDNNLNANIRIKKDSLIWISARKLGFEIARMMISMDSVWLMDRINSQYFAGDYAFFSSKFNVDADYNLIESLLLGNPPQNWSDEPVDIDCRDKVLCKIVYPSRYRINQGRDQRSRPEGSTVVRNEIAISKEHGRILENTFEISGENRKITAGYDRFSNVEKMILPLLVNIVVVNQNEEVILQILADSYKTDDIATFPFRVPSNYKPIVIK